MDTVTTLLVKAVRLADPTKPERYDPSGSLRALRAARSLAPPEGWEQAYITGIQGVVLLWRGWALEAMHIFEKTLQSVQSGHPLRKWLSGWLQSAQQSAHRIHSTA